ncbi:MAG: hypothetical protein U7123_17305 [Potamolinea sp.]
MESIDDLLAQVKADYQEKEQGKQPKKQPLFTEEELQAPPPLPVNYQPQSTAQNWMSPVEEGLLAQVKTELEEKDQGKQPKKQPLFTEKELQAPSSIPVTYQPQFAKPNWVSPVDQGLLGQIKTEFEEKERAEELKRQQQLREEQLKKEQQLREEQLRAQQREQRKREALTQEATEWLKKINPRSEEGRWFEEFSYSYSSKLEAAIDYLQALRETHSY